MEDNFVWTDELVLLALDYAHHNGYHKFPKRCVDVFDEVKNQAMHGGYYPYPKWITEHIQSKQSVDSKDWEIVALRCIKDGSILTKDDDSNMLRGYELRKDYWEIHSVKRLSDNSVWTIGDEYAFLNLGEKCGGRIAKFFTMNGRMFVANEKDSAQASLGEIKKQRQPLFTTEDGKAVYEGDEYWRLDDDFRYFKVSNPAYHRWESEKYFSTAAATKSYIENTQPLLSFNDIVKCIDIGNVYEARLKQLIQQKLNQE